MGNMHYCRFQNTVRDFRECVQALKDEEPISKEEAEAAKELIKLAREIAEMTERDIRIRRL